MVRNPSDTPGYTRNTREGPGKHSGDSNPDRHCFRESRKGKGNMKCDRCFDYNKGVGMGKCAVCGNANLIFTSPQSIPDEYKTHHRMYETRFSHLFR